MNNNKKLKKSLPKTILEQKMFFLHWSTNLNHLYLTSFIFRVKLHNIQCLISYQTLNSKLVCDSLPGFIEHL